MTAWIRRREFITLLGGAAAWSVAARAQQAEQQRRIGLLIGEDYVVFVGAFREELHKLGWSDGRNLRIDMRPSAAELIAINPDVMIAENTPAVQDLQRHTGTIPIVFVGLGDPVLTGVVASLARPGGNATGFMNPEPSISGKWLELLKEIAPATTRILVLLNANNVANVMRLRAIQASALSLNVRVSSSAVRDAVEIEAAIHGMQVSPMLVLLSRQAHPTTGFAKRSLHWRPAIACRGSTHIGTTLRMVASCRTERIASHLATSRLLCRPYPPRREARRPASAGADEIRTGDQPQDCQGAGLICLKRPRPRRRGDRMSAQCDGASSSPFSAGRRRGRSRRAAAVRSCAPRRRADGIGAKRSGSAATGQGVRGGAARAGMGGGAQPSPRLPLRARRRPAARPGTSSSPWLRI